MSIENQLRLFAAAVGGDIKDLYAKLGDPTLLTTTDKTNLVHAINELQAGVATVDIGLIDDASTSTDRTWSSTKITAMLQALKDEIVAGAPGAFDTLKEIADYLAANTTHVNDMLTTLAKCVRFDATQSLTVDEQLTAQTNIDIGDATFDLAALYQTSKGSTPPPPPPPAGSSSPEADTTGGESTATFNFTSGSTGDSGGVTGNNFNFS